MATYLALLNWTDQGVRNVKEAPGRARRAAELAEQTGCKLVAAFMTMGPYDLAVRLEAPDDTAVARFMLALGALGNVRTTTMKAFTMEEFEAIVGSLP
jgi:uncharacterized protein with GYD domain